MLRKIFLVLFLLLIPNVALADDAPPAAKPDVPKPAAASDAILGSWQLTSAKMGGQEMPAPSHFSMALNFQKDARWSVQLKSHDQRHEATGSWSLKGNVLHMAAEEGGGVDFKVSFDAEGMHVTIPHKQEIIVTFKRQRAAASPPKTSPKAPPTKPAAPGADAG